MLLAPDAPSVGHPFRWPLSRLVAAPAQSWVPERLRELRLRRRSDRVGPRSPAREVEGYRQPCTMSKALPDVKNRGQTTFWHAAMYALMAVEAVNEAEQRRLKNSGSYSCNLQDLKPTTRSRATEDPATMVELLRSRGYKLTLSGCTTNTYRAVALPESGSGTAVCSDESGGVRSSVTGKAADCWQSGRPMK